MRPETALEIAKNQDYTLEEKMYFHLALSFKQPLHQEMAPILCDIVRTVDARGPMNHSVELPHGINFRGESTMTAWELFYGFQLVYFLANRRDTLPS